MTAMGGRTGRCGFFYGKAPAPAISTTVASRCPQMISLLPPSWPRPLKPTEWTSLTSASSLGCRSGTGHFEKFNAPKSDKTRRRRRLGNLLIASIAAGIVIGSSSARSKIRFVSDVHPTISATTTHNSLSRMSRSVPSVGRRKLKSPDIGDLSIKRFLKTEDKKKTYACQGRHHSSSKATSFRFRAGDNGRSRIMGFLFLSISMIKKS